MLPTAVDDVKVSRFHEGQSEPARALILQHLGLARGLASRYNGRGEPYDELVQVAMVGLVLAANRFDPERGTSFASYAVPTILGELRRHFRDHCWAVHVPRPLHDLYQDILHSSDRLTAVLGRPATVRDLAADLDVTEDQIVEAQESGHAYSVQSLDSPAPGVDDDTRTLGDLIGGEDGRLEHVEQREAVRRSFAQVPARERRILMLSFFGERTQAQIAEDLGMSQMHVSRLLAMTIAKIRESVMNDAATPLEWPKPRRRRRQHAVHGQAVHSRARAHRGRSAA